MTSGRGTWPAAIEYITGTTAPQAAIGATIDIVPMARPL